MSKLVRPLFLLTLLCLPALSLGCRTSPIPQDLRKELVTRWDDVLSFSANFELTGYASVGPADGTNASRGTIEWTKTSNRMRYRIHSIDTNVTNTGERTIRGQTESIATDDGRVNNLWIRYKDDEEFENIGRRRSYRRFGRAPAYIVEGGKELFNELRESTGQVTIGSGSHEGFSVVIFETQESMEFPIGNILPERWEVHVARDTGIPLRLVVTDDKERVITTISYSNIKVNPEIDEERFSSGKLGPVDPRPFFP